jgi:CheY-like chemotaxis protein
MPRKHILMLEDDSDDRYITQTAIAELNLDIDISFFSNSNDFLNSLTKISKPSLLLVDYNSTPENGFEVLKKIKAIQSIKEVPVIILSDSNADKYRAECYAYGSSSFITKPQTVEATAHKIETFFKYWFTVAEV